MKDDLSTEDLLRAAQESGVFDFLNEPEEDIYSQEDGVPFEEESVKKQDYTKEREKLLKGETIESISTRIKDKGTKKEPHTK